MTDALSNAPGNLLADLPEASAGEIFTPIVRRRGCTIERIVSLGQITPVDAPYRQDHDEWVLLLAGRAVVDVGGCETTLLPGDHLLIPRGEAHRVIHTDPHDPTVWLAVHINEVDR